MYPLLGQKESQHANLRNRKMEPYHPVGVSTAGTTTYETLADQYMSPVWLLYCLLNYDPHPFFRWVLIKLLPFTK